MCGGDVNLASPVAFEDFCRSADRAGGADHVVEHKNIFVLDRPADDIFLTGLLRAAPPLVHNRQFASQALYVAQGPFDAAFIGADHHDVFGAELQIFEVLVQNGSGVEVVHGHVKESLDLSGVQVHGQHPVGAGPRDQVGDQLGRDRDPAFVFTILSSVSVVGHHGRDAFGTGSLAAFDHDQQFHQVIIDRGAGGLDQEDVAAADILQDLARRFSVGEISQRDLTGGQSQVAADPLRQRFVGSPRKEFDVFHFVSPCTPGWFVGRRAGEFHRSEGTSRDGAACVPFLLRQAARPARY